MDKKRVRNYEMVSKMYFFISCIFNFLKNILKNKRGSKIGYNTIVCYSKE